VTQLREVEASVEAQKHELAVQREVLTKDMDELHKARQALDLREKSVATTEKRQTERAVEQGKQASALRDRTVELNAQEESVRNAHAGLFDREAAVSERERSVEALRVEVVALRHEYEAKLAQLRAIVG
jgi:hypothetical protein